jgi:hypothetical protein
MNRKARVSFTDLETNLRATLYVILFLSMNSTLFAAEIQKLDVPGDVSFFSVSGELDKDDGSKFEKIIKNTTKGIVILDSIGGSLSAGLWIGSTINTAGLSTFVPPDKTCASACALAWLGGRNRYFYEGVKIGFHAAYYLDKGVPIESGVANAKIGVYLNELKFPLTAVVFVTTASPSEIFWLTKENAELVGISTKEFKFNNSQIVLPSIPQKKHQVNDAIFDLDAIALKVSKAFTVQYKKHGILGLKESSNLCIARAKKNKTEPAIAYCFMLDAMANYVDVAAQKSFNAEETPYFNLKTINSRADKMFNILSYTEEQRRSKSESWTSLAIKTLNRPH